MLSNPWSLGVLSGSGIVNIGFTGRQTLPTVEQTQALEWFLKFYKPFCLHHGDCLGADTIASAVAISIGGNVLIHPPIDGKKRAFCVGAKVDPKPYLQRNHDIVDASDFLLAVPSGPEHLRNGEWATVRYARKQNKPVFIFLPNGDIRSGSPLV